MKICILTPRFPYPQYGGADIRDDARDTRARYDLFQPNYTSSVMICSLLLVFCLFSLPALAATKTDKPNTDAFTSCIHKLELDNFSNDLSDDTKIKVDKPSCAYINITGIDILPTTKTKKNVWIDAYLGDGNYFRKRAFIAAQGNSSLMFPKKNFSIEFCNDEWIGDDKPDIVFGNWVKQDSYHLKAYYIDWLRGVGVVSYSVYDRIATDRGRAWTRYQSAISKPDQNALCYPDGFPCIVYFNGDFYGIYAWQLKKNHKNMNQKKDVAGHIHLDGNLGNDDIWKTNMINWEKFEVRNPKNLYTMDGTKYDGDNPKELIDETSPYYELAGDDEETTRCKSRTAQVKKHIISLSQIHDQMEILTENGVTDAEKRAFFEEHFDIGSLIDYACFHLTINNYDGFTKNWQWFTYDGKKWIVAPYDLDATLGNFASGKLLVPANYNTPGERFYSIRSHGPFYWINRLYFNDICERYCQLRSHGVITPSTIINLIDDWYSRVGEDNYTTEWNRWSESLCISETVVNPGWRMIEWQHGLDKYDDSKGYRTGDKCMLDYICWEATETVQGISPYNKIGYTDNLQRYKDWIDQRIALVDEYCNYIDNTSGIDVSKGFSKTNSRTNTFEIYDTQGRRLSSPSHGFNIYRYSDGKSEIIFR